MDRVVVLAKGTDIHTIAIQRHGSRHDIQRLVERPRQLHTREGTREESECIQFRGIYLIVIGINEDPARIVALRA